MAYTLKVVDGKVEFIYRAGEDFVRNRMVAASASSIVAAGTMTESSFNEFPIAVNDTFFFAGEITGTKKTVAKEEVK